MSTKNQLINIFGNIKSEAERDKFASQLIAVLAAEEKTIKTAAEDWERRTEGMSIDQKYNLEIRRAGGADTEVSFMFIEYVDI